MQVSKFRIGVLVSLILFSFANLATYEFDKFCFDCAGKMGFPIIFWKFGGFAHSNKIIWYALLIDLSVAFLISFFGGWLILLLFEKIRRAS